MATTYFYEDKLPRLPVPLLDSTVTQLLDALKPLMSTEEYERLVQEAKEFVDNDHIELIQRHLEAISRNENNTCYLNSINDDIYPGIYGELRGDILPRNPYLILEDDPYLKTINPPDQAHRAASLINSTLKFVLSIRNETLKPDITPKNQNPLTMKCYRNLFGTSRIPVEEAGGHSYHVSLQKYEDINDSRHIIVICNNQYYALELLTVFKPEEYRETGSKHKIWFSDHELALLLQEIIDASGETDKMDVYKDAFGALTTQTFTFWNQGRKELQKSNGAALKMIDDALFVVALDPNSPSTDNEKTAIISHGSSELLKGTNLQGGSCTSRWYDKLQLIVTKNSVAGVVWESASMDSTAILRFISDIYTDSILKLAKNINGSEYTLFDGTISFVSASDSTSKPTPVKLILNRTKELLHLVRLSETRLADIINQHDYETLTIRLNTLLVSKLGLSIDSVLQVAVQIANYSLYGRIANTLEPITTRKFRDARTELIPVQNEHIDRLVKTFISESDASFKWELFQDCCRIHTKQYLDAMVGKGFERHFLTLSNVLKRQRSVDYLNRLNKNVKDLPPIPSLGELRRSYIPLLSNPLIEKISSPEIIISNCGNPAMRLFGIPPAADHGFGIGYIIHKDKVIVTVSSKFRQNSRFLDTLNRVSLDLLSMIVKNSDFLINISDSETRKLELQLLRVEQELEKVDSSLPLTRHPIDITVNKTPIPVQNLKLDDNNARSRSNLAKSGNENNHDYDILGGYGYFSFGDVDFRSDQLSRQESFFDSSSNLNSKNHSTDSLSKASSVHESLSDIKQRRALTAKIRNTLSQESLEKPSKEDPASINAALDASSKSKSPPGKLLSMFDI